MEYNNNNSSNNNSLTTKYNIPIIDFNDINNNKIKISNEIDKACRECGFFYIINHGLDESLIQDLISYSKKFFLLPYDVKMKWKVGNVERGLYGYFGIGKQVIVGKDYKEGYYVDIEKQGDGNSLFPTKDEEIQYDLVGFKDFIKRYINSVVSLGDKVFELIALALNLPYDYFKSKYTYDPAIFLSILKYPSKAKIEGDEFVDETKKFGIGNHFDWPLITLLCQNQVGGLQVQFNNEFVNVDPIKGSFICNVGDLLEIATRGHYVSSCHRAVYNKSSDDRYSFPLFIGPQLDEPIETINNFKSLPIIVNQYRSEHQVKNQDFYNFSGSYRQYYEMKLKNTFNDYLNEN